MTWLSPLLAALSIGTAIVYFRGWQKLRIHAGGSIPLWRSICFPGGLLLIWLATSSTLATLDDELLTAHMVQHLLLMSVAPFLILWSRPKMPLLLGLPVGFVRTVVGPISRTRLAHLVSGFWRRPVFCWVVSIGVLIFWHVPFFLRPPSISSSGISWSTVLFQRRVFYFGRRWFPWTANTNRKHGRRFSIFF